MQHVHTDWMHFSHARNALLESLGIPLMPCDRHEACAGAVAEYAACAHRYGPAVPVPQREAACKVIMAVAILWLLSIVVGGWLHLGRLLSSLLFFTLSMLRDSAHSAEGTHHTHVP